MTEVIAEIRRVLSQELDVTALAEPSSDLVQDLQLDSVALITLAVSLEDKFRVKLSEADASTVRTVEDLARLVLRRMAEGPKP
jgi:acyl carrier protein